MSLDVLGSGPRWELGEAIRTRAEEVGSVVVDSWLQRAGEADTQCRTRAETIHYTAQLATELVGRWLATGQGAMPLEVQELAKRSATIVRGHFAIADVVKNYLTWRDATLHVLRQEASRLGSSRALASQASVVVRHSADTSIVNMVREYDGQLSALQQELDEERAKLTDQALHDPLTGLANRTLLLDRLTQALAASARGPQVVGVLYLDLDGFKAVNDRLGHAAGDRLLTDVAQRLLKIVRPHDTVARIGGDEFVIICDLAPPAQHALDLLTDRIRRGIAGILDPTQRPLVTVSIGATCATGHDDPEAVLARADKIMYEVKQQVVPIMPRQLRPAEVDAKWSHNPS